MAFPRVAWMAWELTGWPELQGQERWASHWKTCSKSSRTLRQRILEMRSFLLRTHRSR